MTNQDDTKKEIIQKMNEILELTLPRCNDGNIYENIFIAINKRAYEAIKELERLVIQKLKQ